MNSAASPEPKQKPIRIPDLARMKAAAEKITMLTSYDASFAVLADAAGIDVVLVGDSLGNVIQGHSSTLPVTVDDMVYHTRAVARGLERALLVSDLPFMADRSSRHALDAAARLMGEGGAAMVKLEGAGPICEVMAALSARRVPVCGHLGLTPQSVHALGGYRVQGRDHEAAGRLLEDARQVAAAGADMLVLECVPATLGAQVSAELAIPVIGIGAGAGCDGQVLVVYDMLGISRGPHPRFVKNFLAGRDSVQAALEAYVEAVRSGEFPAPEHGW